MRSLPNQSFPVGILDGDQSRVALNCIGIIEKKHDNFEFIIFEDVVVNTKD